MRIFSRKRARPTRKDACGPSDIAGAGSSGAFDDACPDVVPLWCLRALVHLEGRKRMVRYGNVDEDILDVVGLGHLPDDELQERPLKAALERRLVALEARAPALPDPLGRNLHLIGEPLSLDRAERLLLAFAVLARTLSGLLDCTRTIVLCSGFQSFIHALSVILRLPEAAVRAALRGDGRLAASGLLRLNIAVAHGRDFADRLVVLDDLAEALLVEHESPETLFRPFFSPAPAPRLSAQDLSHLGEDYELVASYLRNAGREGLPGMNILVFGPPGTGKTEFVRTVTAACGLQLFEVATENDTGDAIRATLRFRAYQMSQRVLARRTGCAILFDEVEDVFPEHAGWFSRADHQSGKGWVNRLLESNSVPAFWLTNEAESIDPAYLRRFDIVLKFRAPGRAVRRRILQHYLAELGVGSEWIERAADNDALLPAQIERAARVVRQVRHEVASVERTLARLMESTQDVMGLSMRTFAPALPSGYRLDYLNADCPLASLVEGLARAGRGRICLYGPPGTGKTGFAHYLARELGKPPIVKRASDILSPYVGVAEQHIAAMFERAASEQAILLLDEADSFLRERAGAQRSWEVTQVNELLVQMEAFEGVFICSTNLMSALDEAALRRFDLEIKLDYLRPEQAWRLFLSMLPAGSNKMGCGQATVRSRLAGIKTLTPGDFVAVARRAQILGETLDPDTLLRALQAECSMKKDQRARPIGFVTAA